MSDFAWPTWDEWLAGLDVATRSRAESLRNTFSRLGADEPESWARSEVGEDIPQLGRFVFLRAVWKEIESLCDRDRIAELGGAAGDADDVAARMAARAAFDVAFSIVQLLDNEEDTEAAEPLPGWRLIECDPDGNPTGRALGGLHESVLETDPRGVEGEDIRSW